MKCPECGREVPEGHVYCEGCGWEFHMVPAFEPEIENQIDKTLSRLAGKIDRETQNDARKKTDGIKNDRNGKEAKNEKEGKQRTGKPAKKAVVRRIRPVIAVFCVLIVVLAVAAIHKTTDEYIRYAQKEIKAGNTDKALSYLRTAREKDPKNAQVMFILAGCYRETGDYEACVETLSGIINSAAFSEELTEDAWRLSAEAYDEAGDSDALEALLLKCPYENVKKAYDGYRPEAPAASPAGGTFEMSVTVTLSAQEGCDIYYTLDDSEPDRTSPRYDAPVEITEPGTYMLKAVAYGQKGLRGTMTAASFTVEEKKVPPPEVFEDSGTYREATRIVVHAEKGLEIRYTTDEDAEPDKESPLYEEPVPMPDGRSVFKFIAVDEKGRTSEVVERVYDLVIERPVSEDQAVMNVKAALSAAGYMDAESGQARGESGVLQFLVEDTLTIGNDGEFYVLREYLTQADGKTAETGRMYAVQTRTGKAMRLGYDSFGQVILMQIGS